MTELPDPQTYKYYLRDLGYLLREDARNAKLEREQYRDTEDNDYYVGKLMTYYALISLMHQQAQGFGIPLEDLCLEDIHPDRDLI